MNILNHHPLDRRTLLKGVGATIALPFLESMLPLRAHAASGAAAGASGIPARMAVFYFGTGMNMRVFEPTDAGKNFTLTPTLEPFAPWRDQLTVFSGTYLEYGGGHGGDYPFLTGIDRKAGKMGISADQIAANQIGHQTRFASLQLSERGGTGFGGNLNTLSWTDQGIPLPSMNEPAEVFDLLFKPVNAEQARTNQLHARQRGSVLDAVLSKARSLESKISATDKEKLDEYFSSIRGVEQQLQRDLAWADTPKPTPDTTGMGDFHESFKWTDDPEKYYTLMYDLVALALQTDSTRVITHVVRKESQGGEIVTTGIPDLAGNFHTLSHHGNDPVKLRDLARVDRVYMEHFSHLLKRLSEMKEPDGSSLFDHTMIAFSSGMGIGHSRDRLPSVLLGGKNLGLEHQGHLVLAPNTPLARIWHTMLDRMHVQVPDNFQDSTGPIRELISA